MSIEPTHNKAYEHEYGHEERTCDACGLIYQQCTSGYTDKVMHKACPRCGQYMPMQRDTP
jgi:hypothetical protein